MSQEGIRTEPAKIEVFVKTWPVHKSVKEVRQCLTSHATTECSSRDTVQ